MSAVDIITEAYPWEILLKLAEPLVDKYNLTVVGVGSHMTATCAPFGVIFDGVSTAALATHPHYEVEAYEIETTGVLYFDNSSAELEHQRMFDDLIVPFDLPVWLLCALACCSMSALLKFLYKLQLQLALLAAFGSIIGLAAVPSLNGQKYGQLYTAWLLGGAFISNAYVSMLHSNVVVPNERSTSKSITELYASNYSVIGTSPFSVYNLFNQQYQQTLGKVRESGVSNVTAAVLENYRKLLEMLYREAFSYNYQYQLITSSKTALFGEMHNLNVLRHVLPAEQRKKFKFTEDHFFPKLKHTIHQIHHADVIAVGFKRLISNGIFRYWENIRFLADRLAWWRVLKPILRESWNREKHSSVGMSDSLLLATFHCLIVGLCVGLLACLVEQVHWVMVVAVHKTRVVQLLIE